jgi:hypothetical protein
MDANDLKRLEEAVGRLESPTWTARLTDFVGMPIEWVVSRLPAQAHQAVSSATSAAIQKALGAAVSTMDRRRRGLPQRWLHRGAAAASGGVGGFFGLPGLAVELPISTVVMLRSIADVARSEGEDLGAVDAQLACVQVFGLGGRSSRDDGADTGYYAVRIGLARAISEAAEFIARRGMVEQGAPVIVRFVSAIAARFNVVVTEKVAAQTLPVVGAACGAAVNVAFVANFQRVASGHFAVRSLEREWGFDAVRVAYEAIAAREGYRGPRPQVLPLPD